MRLIIAGSRGIMDYSILQEEMRELVERGFMPSEIIIGGAAGTYEMGIRWAAENGITIVLENISVKDMVERGDMLLVIWNGMDREVEYLIEEMKKRGKGVVVRYVNRGR